MLLYSGAFEPPGTKELDRIKANRFQVDPKLAALSYQAELKELNDHPNW